MNKEGVLLSFFSGILFLGCAIYVAFEGYKCLSKYLKEPVSIDISYHFTGQVLALSFTLCTQFYNYQFETRFPDSYDEQTLEKCNITRNEYIGKSNQLYSKNLMLFKNTSILKKCVHL